MTHASYWAASDGTQLHYRYDDFTDQWQGTKIRCPTLIVEPGAHPMGTGSAFVEMGKRIPNAERVVYAHGRHNVFDYLPERCVADTLAFLRKHFPEECS